MLTRNESGAAELGGVVLSSLFDGGRVETPAYVYDLGGIEAGAKALAGAFGKAPSLVAYAMKANSAGPVVRTLISAGCGVEVVSGAELSLALACGAAPDRILFSGVAKRNDEIDAALGAGEQGILALQIESVEEIARIEARAAACGRTARVVVRVNPGIEADTHAHVATGHDEAKFGVALEDLDAAWAAFERSPHVALAGLSNHVGSQLTELDAYLEAAARLASIAKERRAAGAKLTLIDFGGGFGIDYGQGCRVAPADFARGILRLVADSGLEDLRIVVEPGRSLVAAHGVLCAGVLLAKRSRSGRRWLMVDAGMNDLIRPALYAAHHRIEAMDRPPPTSGATRYRVVGPVCESSDDFGAYPFEEPTPSRVVIRDAGAYGFTMASQYNGRRLPSEVFLRDGRIESVKASPSADAWVASRR